MASGRSRELTKSEHPIIRATVDIGHVAGRLFICIGVCIGQWFIGIRRMP
jgi:hypothetical protein